MLQNIILVALMSLNGSDLPGIPLVMNDLDDYGYVWDLNLGFPDIDNWNCALNGQSCVPTSWVNSMVYLQNQHASELDGLELAGSDYAAWSENVVILRSPANMNTSDHGLGTTAFGQVNGMINYLNNTGVGPLATQCQAIAAPIGLALDDSVPQDAYPDWLIRGMVDIHQLAQWLNNGAAVVIDVLWEHGNTGMPNNNGHALAVVGLQWTDDNQNGFMDFEEALLYVIDPMDPTPGRYTDDGHQPIGPAIATPVQVWQKETPTDLSVYGMLNIQYDVTNSNACQAYDPTTSVNNGWISGAFALSIIGGPGGSCCLATGCDVLTEVDCTELGGTWTLSGSCDDCAPTCTGDNDNDGIVGIEDLLILIDRWGFCP